MKIRFCGLSDVGKRREKNEDSFLIHEASRFCIVADGMGGHVGGEYASRLAVETVQEVLSALEKDPDLTLEEGANVRPGDFSSYLRYAIAEASARIYEKAREDPKLKGMGTTTVVALFRKGVAYIANVGDSRGYRIRGGEILQLTKDHSLVGEQLRAGFLSEGDAKSHRLKNIITRSVGFQETVEVDVDIRALKEGDRFLLCSDGLSNMVESREMADLATHHDLSETCRRLVDIANERGGDDNITVVMCEVEALEKHEKERDDDTTLEVD